MAQENLSKTFNNALNVKTVSSTETLKKTDSGKLIALDMSTGFTLTLPPCEAGLNFKILIKAGGTDGNMKIAAAPGDCFFGSIVSTAVVANDKISVQSIQYSAATGTPGNYDHLTLDGDATTSGGLSGEVIDLIAVDSSAWAVNALLTIAGTSAASIAVINAG